ncbi:MAG TPA: endonuclease/exonuclease/phosphatase family protein [Pararhizobium sp.]|nr:endonuclease/exonuclease/phosphatase family protein [Pararhizobium sp.]
MIIETGILALLTGILLAATLLSFLKVAHGFVRSFSFPRIQMLVLAIALVPFTLLLVGGGWLWTLLLAQAVVIVVQVVAIARFTPLWKTQSKAYCGSPDDPNTVCIMSSNVKMSNRDYARAVELARKIDPDVAVFMETDQAWVDALMTLSEKWPNVVSHPLDNAYGMILFSRLPLDDAEVNYLVLDEVPSFQATVTLRDGQRFRFHSVHPEPPVPYLDSAGRDAELLRVADIVKAEALPSIVTGDLNDVAWSHTTRLFQRVSRLLDPRVGRGFYNTFDARYFFLRWPLDHLFHDARFALIEMRRLPYIGSDHFPMYFKLALTGSAAGVDMPAPEDAEDREEKREIQKEGDELDREAIGIDWESEAADR